MSKANWGVLVAIAVAVAIVLLVGPKILTKDKGSAETSSGGAVAEPARQQQVAPLTVSTTGDLAGAETSAAAGGDAGTETADSGGQPEVGREAGPGRETAVSSGEPEAVRESGAGRETAAPSGEPEAVRQTGAGTAETATSAGGTGSELQQEAESFVEELTASSEEPVQLSSAEGFVGPERPLTPGTATATTGEAESAAQVGAGELAAAEGGLSKTRASGPAAEQGTLRPSETAAAAGGGESAQPEAGGAENAGEVTVDLPLSEDAPITIAEILKSQTELSPDAVYYVHTVQSGDDQGIWGIVQAGVLGNFAEGVAVRRGEKLNTYRVDIPPDADELRADHSSSFLGRLIYEKSRDSFVYNYKTGRIGKNPDFIKPGQELVIVSFTPEELVEIYKHFVQQEG